MHFDTLAIHFAQEPDPTTGALVAPIAQTSTFVQESPGVHKGFDYSRTNNPTRQTLERVLAALEGGADCAVFASGLAAENALLQAYVRPGDEVLTTPDLYGGTYRLLNDVFDCHRVGDLTDIRSNTRIVWVESPTNPRLQTHDIRRAAEAARTHGALLVVDNTFATPVNQRPFELGADFVIHSVTKYLSGHSDVIQGAVLARDPELFAPVRRLQNATGAVPSPFDCWLTLRGLKTLRLRVERHNENARAVARALEEHEAVERVYHPGFGGVVSAEIGAPVDAFLSHLRLFQLGESLGGVKSLVCHPARMTHASIPPEARAALGLRDNLVRFSVGLEDVRDLVADVQAACSNSVYPVAEEVNR